MTTLNNKHNSCCILRAIICFSTLLFASPILVGQEKLSKSNKISIATGYKTGDITYQIGGRLSQGQTSEQAHFPISELVFPRSFATLQANLYFSLPHQREAALTLETNASKNAGKLIDRDWLLPNQLDIYSESDTQVNSRELTLEFVQRFRSTGLVNSNNTFLYKLGLGAIIQSYKYSAFDTIQSYPSSNEPPIQVYGDVLYYRFSMIAPFFSLGFTHDISPDLQVDTHFILSPLLFIEDKDEHLRRDKWAESKTHGWLFQFSIMLSWQFNQSVGLTSQFSYESFDAEGEQTQHPLTGGKLKAEAKHMGVQSNFKVGVYYTF